MASKARLVLIDLLTALRTAHFHYDLTTDSSTVRVVIADGGHPPVRPPYVLLTAPRMKSAYEGAPLTEYHRTWEMEWWAFAPCTVDTTENRAYGGLDIADDVVTAIENAHHNPSFTALYELTTLLVSYDDVFADGLDEPVGSAQVHGTIEFSTTLTRGG